jgi:hypothetical protein
VHVHVHGEYERTHPGTGPGGPKDPAGHGNGATRAVTSIARASGARAAGRPS